MPENIDNDAKIIWDYMRMSQDLGAKKYDAIFVLGSRDDRCANYAAELFLEGRATWLIFSGKNGRKTHDLFHDTEAAHFAKIAIEMGVPKSAILLEDKSTNTGENIQFTAELLREKGLHPKSFLLVQKPYMERRTYAAFRKQWPDPESSVAVTSPPISYGQYFNEANQKDDVLNIMLADLWKIRHYPAKGFQIEQDIPANVWHAYERLATQGYDKFIPKNEGA